MFNIKNVTIKNGACLAPMAGVTDSAFRSICENFNASFTVSEMVSSKALVMGDKKTKSLMTKVQNKAPFGIQVFGNEPNIIGEACSIIEKFNPDFIDLNCGCPAPKITGNKGGSNLLNTPTLIYDIVKQMKDCTKKPITVKIRIGYNDNNINGLEVAKIIEKAGASMLTVHGRTRQQMYLPPVNYDIIKKIKEEISIPIIANGDIYTLENYIKIKEYTKADEIMIGRGSLGNPFIFNEIYQYINFGKIIPPPTIEERLKIMSQHIKLLCKQKGEYIGMKEARKHCAWYMKGLKGANILRKQCGSLTLLSDINTLIYKVLEINSV